MVPTWGRTVPRFHRPAEITISVGSSSAMASAVSVAAVDRLAVLIEPLWGQYAFLHKLIESRLHCFFDLIPHPVRVRVELGLHSPPLFVVRQHVHPRL